jgi:uncharacterized protein YjbJ (UPF0337 family)
MRRQSGTRRSSIGREGKGPPANPQPPKNMKSSSQDKAEGHGKDLKGNIKEGTGRLVGDRNLEAEGRADQAEGKAQKKVGDVKKVFDK